MQISKRQAEEIIHYLKSTIQEDINFIDPSGLIIASSDVSRVGDFHAGAVEVARTRKPVMIDHDNMFEGAKKGINLPVFYEQNLMAVIGITGEIDDIIQFSNVIVKMSEILIKENFLNTQKQFKRENNRIIMELITKDKFNPEILKSKMDELGYNPKKYHYFLIADLHQFDQHNIELSNLIYNSIEKRLNIEDILARSGSKFMLMSQHETFEALHDSFLVIKDYVEKKYKIQITTGVSEYFEGIKSFFNAYKQANMVVHSNAYLNTAKIVSYDGSSLEFLFKNLATKDIDFSNRVLKGLKKEELLETQELIKHYIEENGSINAVSEALFIHKNTVQYRLNKIAQLTGYNPRNLKDLMSLYIALELYTNDTDSSG